MSLLALAGTKSGVCVWESERILNSPGFLVYRAPIKFKLSVSFFTQGNCHLLLINLEVIKNLISWSNLCLKTLLSYSWKSLDLIQIDVEWCTKLPVTSVYIWIYFKIFQQYNWQQVILILLKHIQIQIPQPSHIDLGPNKKVKLLILYMNFQQVIDPSEIQFLYKRSIKFLF